jgi:hypothetical protein
MTVATALAVSWKAVDKLETECDQQRQSQQKIRPDAGDGDRFHVPGYVECDEAQAAGQSDQKQCDARAAGLTGHVAIKPGAF